MPQRHTPVRVETITKDGEVHLLITLDINLNLNADGLMSIAVQGQRPALEEEDKVQYPIPDFSSGAGFAFGKKLGG